jgi:hypothetical protein
VTDPEGEYPPYIRKYRGGIWPNFFCFALPP